MPIQFTEGTSVLEKIRRSTFRYFGQVLYLCSNGFFQEPNAILWRLYNKHGNPAFGG
jgi:hypothetical protein